MARAASETEMAKKDVYQTTGLSGVLRWSTGILLVSVLLANPQVAARGASRAIEHWYASVVPSLFPFLALMPLLTCREAVNGYASLFSGVTRALFVLPGTAAPAIIIGMIAGVPAGAIASREVASRSGMNCGQLKRTALSITGFSPAFLISGIGASMLGNANIGWMLLVAQLLTQLTMLCLLRCCWRSDADPVTPAPDFISEQPIRAAVLTLLTICGYMALFGSITSVCREGLGARVANGLLCLLDVPSGVQVIAGLSLTLNTRLVLLAAMCSMGGVCVALQNLASLKGCGLSVVEYVLVRTTAALINAGWMVALLYVPAISALHMREMTQGKALSLATLVVSMLAFPVLLRMKRASQKT